MDHYLIYIFLFPVIAAVYGLIIKGHNPPEFRIIEYGDGRFWIERRNGFVWTRNLKFSHGCPEIEQWHTDTFALSFPTLEKAMERINKHYEYIEKEKTAKIRVRIHYPFSPATSSTQDHLLIEAGKLFMEGKEREGYAVLDKIKEYMI